MSSGPIAVFLDRDGTLNEEVDFVRSPDQLELIEGAAAAVRALNQRGILTCVISNQSGVARGLLSESDLVSIHNKLKQSLEREGARVDRIYYCPHHPTEGNAPYNIECDCRKPKPGMLLQGEADLGIDLSRSFVVGDSVVDMQAGAVVGATNVLVLTGYGMIAREESRKQNIPIDFVAPSIHEAVQHILKKLEGSLKK